jgi:cyclopropane fatty-acyl-phospholipid synthase-like methyltransferase
MLTAANLRPGEHVLDVGCGNGATTLAAMRRVAPSGEVFGIDLSANTLALAQHRAEEAGCDNAHSCRPMHRCTPSSKAVLTR